MFKEIRQIIFISIALIFPVVIYAESMTSENYNIEADRISSGMISIPDASSENYQVNISFGQQDILELSEPEGNTGGGGGGGRPLLFALPLIKEQPKQAPKEELEIEEKTPPIIIVKEEVEIEEVGIEEVEIKVIPEQLFDINFEIDEVVIINIKDLFSRAIFTSFGTIPTPVDLTFTILNESGETVHTEKDYIIVETEEVLTKKFESLELSLGKYTLVLNTLYNIDVEDEFRQEFEIVKEKASILSSFWFWGLVSLIILLVIFSIVFLIRKRSKKNLKANEKIENKD